MKKKRLGVSPKLMLLLLFAIIVPSGLLVLFGFQAVTNERYVLEHKILSGYRESAGSLALSIDQQIKQFDHFLRTTDDFRNLNSDKHPLVKRVFFLGYKDRINYPSRLFSRREIPAVYFSGYSQDFIRLYGREISGNKSVCGDYIEYSRKIRPQAGEEYYLALAAIARCGISSGNPRLGLEAAMRIINDTLSSAKPLGMSKKVLGYLSAYRLLRQSKDVTSSVNILNDFFGYMSSDTAELYEEEFEYYTNYVIRELSSISGKTDYSRLKESALSKIQLDREISSIEAHADKGELPDSGFVYLDSNVYYLCRSVLGQKTCIRINTDALIDWTRQWLKKRENLALTVSFSDGSEMISTIKTGTADDQIMAVTESFSKHMPFLNVTVGEKNPGEVYSLIRHQRSLYMLFLGVLLLAIAAGVGLIYAAVRREVEVARMRSNFISGVSHELRTPLTSIHMLSEMLQTGKITEEKKKSEYYNLITRESERLTALINKILDFSKIDEGRIKYDFESHDLEALMDDALMSMTALLDERKANVVRIRPDVPVRVKCDRKMLTQVIVNLIDNAVKYSPEQPEIIMKTYGKNVLSYLSIRDHGIGIQPDEEQRIFEEFYRSSHERIKEVKGTGLGLAIVKKIVEDHSGTVTAKTAPGGGLEVTVALPSA